MVSSLESGLSSNTSKSKHSKTSVSNLAGLHFLDLVLSLSLEELKRIKLVVSSVAISLSPRNLHEDSSSTELHEPNSPPRDAGRARPARADYAGAQ